jgi:hypothetical protein
MNQTTTEALRTPQPTSKQKLLAFADAIDALQRPVMEWEWAQAVAEEADRRLQYASRSIREYINAI